MVKHIVWDPTMGGWYVDVESYYGEHACVFFWKSLDAENWNPFA